MSNLNIFKIKQRTERAGGVIDVIDVEGNVVETEFKLVELSYWEAGQVVQATNHIGMTCWFGMRKLDGSKLFDKFEDLEQYPADLFAVYQAINELSDRVPAEAEEVVELEKK